MTLERQRSSPRPREDVFVVLRCAGERTESVCRQLLADQVPDENLAILRERPFEKALERGFEHALESKSQWTVCVDADVLIAPALIPFLVDVASDLPSDHFGFTGYIYDKFLRRKRAGGPHTYRTALLAEALGYLPRVHGSLRPETEVKRHMQRAGKPWATPKLIFGLHDFGQYYRDIFRKMVVRAFRARGDDKLNMYLTRVQSQAAYDIDAKVALMGLRHGGSIRDDAQVSLDARAYRATAEQVLREAGIDEKKAIDSRSAAQDFLSSLREFDINQYVLRRQARGRKIAAGRCNPVQASFYRLANRVSAKLHSF
ncbi:MAG: hypothetical protein MPN21_01350 [Thermoanaerobaculia bacterium]|nr:hypothetical protein [Thermoanaerobaculia bacterium]